MVSTNMTGLRSKASLWQCIGLTMLPASVLRLTCIMYVPYCVRHRCWLTPACASSICRYIYERRGYDCGDVYVTVRQRVYVLRSAYLAFVHWSPALQRGSLLSPALRWGVRCAFTASAFMRLTASCVLVALRLTYRFRNILKRPT